MPSVDGWWSRDLNCVGGRDSEAFTVSRPWAGACVASELRGRPGIHYLSADTDSCTAQRLLLLSHSRVSYRRDASMICCRQQPITNGWSVTVSRRIASFNEGLVVK